MKTFQIVIEGQFEGDATAAVSEINKQETAAGASLLTLAQTFAANLNGAGNVRRAGLSIGNPPGHHAADSQYHDLLQKPEQEADPQPAISGTPSPVPSPQGEGAGAVGQPAGSDPGPSDGGEPQA